ncbi:hypothetical protein P3T76_010616 [Phytophthora citrophthora]|uniref:RxLR effector PexRD54 WY domain-containing protein n=1 Tax=Phytophthora citrophthora TaxID=4793 RepID=A0AAD9LGG5_9STRA|nr:hypothetical protein P3T76_010616 [Phytophthora citrophthora]
MIDNWYWYSRYHKSILEGPRHGRREGVRTQSGPWRQEDSNLLTDKKLSKYLNNDREIDEVFSKLKLNTAGEKLFENPKFLAWSKYVDDFNQKHQTQHSMLPTLVRQYGGDDLSIMLEKAKQADKTYVVALKLQGEQMKLWRREGLTADKFFSIYKLDDGATNLLENPGIKIWMRYADEFTGEPTTLFKKLQKTYSDEHLSKILNKGMTVSSSKKLVSDLQNQQIRHWLETGQPPENIFKRLSLHKEGDNLFSSPQVQTWILYNSAYARQNPHAHKVKLIDALLENYDTSPMVSMLKTKPKKLYREHLAAGTERDLIKRWVSDGKPLEFVVTGKLGTTGPQNKFVTSWYLKYKTMQTAA